MEGEGSGLAFTLLKMQLGFASMVTKKCDERCTLWYEISMLSWLGPRWRLLMPWTGIKLPPGCCFFSSFCSFSRVNTSGELLDGSTEPATDIIIYNPCLAFSIWFLLLPPHWRSISFISTIQSRILFASEFSNLSSTSSDSRASLKTHIRKTSG